MMDDAAAKRQLIEILADGHCHSGESLGRRLGITRAGVWKRLQALAVLDIPLESIKGRGYRIPGGLDLLNSDRIVAGTAAAVAQSMRLICLDEVDSTSQYLLRQGRHGDVCLAEHQTAGRGRRGRQWQSPYGSNLYLSLRWHFDQGVAVLEGLSLAVGVILVEALASLGMTTVRLKWPNDLLVEGGKLGGMLIDVGGDLTGECVVVIGIGINVDRAPPLSAAGALPPVSLRQAGYRDGRNLLCSRLLSLLLPRLQAYPAEGFAAYRSRWERHCAYLGEAVTLGSPAESHGGILLGVDDQGSLRLQTAQGEKRFSGGELSLRKPAPPVSDGEAL